MSYTSAQYVTGWRFKGPHDGEKIRIYLKPFSCRPPIRRYESVKLKMKVKDVENLVKIVRRYLDNMNLCVEIGASR